MRQSIQRFYKQTSQIRNNINQIYFNQQEADQLVIAREAMELNLIGMLKNENSHFQQSHTYEMRY